MPVPSDQDTLLDSKNEKLVSRKLKKFRQKQSTIRILIHGNRHDRQACMFSLLSGQDNNQLNRHSNGDRTFIFPSPESPLVEFVLSGPNTLNRYQNIEFDIAFSTDDDPSPDMLRPYSKAIIVVSAHDQDDKISHPSIKFIPDAYIASSCELTQTAQAKLREIRRIVLSQNIIIMLDTMTGDDKTGQKIHRRIMGYAIAAAGIGATPIPFVGMPFLILLQLKMYQSIASLHQQTINRRRLAEISGALGVSFLGDMSRQEFSKLIPLYGSTVATAMAGAQTYSLGKTLDAYFRAIKNGPLTDQQNFRRFYQQQLKEGKQLLQRLKQSRKS